MAIETVIKKIDRYLQKDNGEPLVVDIQNKSDLEAIIMHYKLPQNTFVCASDSVFCKPDEFPAIANILETLAKKDKNFFVREISSFYMLEGERALSQELKELLSMNIAGHVVILTYQCADYLWNLIKNDRRLENRICILDGPKHSRPKLVFVATGIKNSKTNVIIKGIHEIAKTVEAEISGQIYIETEKCKNTYPHSLYAISEMKCPYEILCNEDALTSTLTKDMGNDSEWIYALAEFESYPSWELLVSAKIGNIHNLDISITAYRLNSADKRWFWLYFIGLKLFGAGNDWYLNNASAKATSPSELIHYIYRCILDLEPTDHLFATAYERRKVLLSAIGNPVEENVGYCKIILSKGKDALYYVTDGSIQEKELIFKLLDKYGAEFERATLLIILARIYPDLYHYLTPYRFKNNLLNSYFQEYKYQKVINRLFPEFMTIVEQQAINRDYNTILQPRSAVIECLDTMRTQTYFTDAMGVEFLGYIMSKCHTLQLMAKVTVCRCELPSITSRNKEFWDILSTNQYPIITIDKIDNIKHHGGEGYDYSREERKLPIHLIRELELIDDLLEKIKINLLNESYGKAILIADHGASRLAVIHESENLWEMGSSGKHSGRCCPKSEIDVKPDSAADADDFWALANYDRFKGSRKANVEVHGGATLEEITVPIIEITYLNTAIEVKIMPIDALATFTGIPEITVSFRKKSSIKIFATQKLMDVSIEIDGYTYEAKAIDDNFYVVEEMPEIRRAKTYTVNIYACGNTVATALPLRVKKESGTEKSLL